MAIVSVLQVLMKNENFTVCSTVRSYVSEPDACSSLAFRT